MDMLVCSVCARHSKNLESSRPAKRQKRPPPPPHASSSCLLLMPSIYTILKPSTTNTVYYSQYVNNYNGEGYALSKCSCFLCFAIPIAIPRRFEKTFLHFMSKLLSRAAHLWIPKSLTAEVILQLPPLSPLTWLGYVL